MTRTKGCKLTFQQMFDSADVILSAGRDGRVWCAANEKGRNAINIALAAFYPWGDPDGA
jgi:hypothetical protein